MRQLRQAYPDGIFERFQQHFINEHNLKEQDIINSGLTLHGDLRIGFEQIIEREALESDKDKDTSQPYG